MEFLIMLVLLAGGGLFAYRQWRAIQTEAQTRRIEPYPTQTTVIEPDEPPVITGWTEPESMFALRVGDRPPPAPPKPKINKWVLFGLAVLYLVCPLDGDFIPVVGWLDDAVVMAMGIRALMDKSR